ncbi:hypothetical protein OJ967_12350 [Peribacillus frigoritolerans]|uniref:phage tail protein n=1 Tax=Peribacillus frigoritolerans TaxID=450367 RepID=UPI002227B63A|nr:hypothetical protein [Peribacillus frigoritolerans]UYZ01214.1 hypothetical protein OJ967_12350 [Peribacillus frigoritolerans]
MAVRETHILLDIMADADPLRGINREMDDIIRQSRLMGRSYGDLNDDSRDMMREMNMGWRNQNDAFKKFRNNLVAAEYDFFKLAQVGRRYGGTTAELIRAIDKMGLAHKKATDGMMANDDRMRQSLYRTIGRFANMTPQADKNAAAIARMNNPLYNVNRAGLAVVSSLNRMANNANTARFALQQLGPNASMKDLNEEVKRLNKGLGAMPIVAIGAGLAAYFFYGAIHKAAMENKKYADSFNTMVSTLRKAIQPMIDVFILIMVPVYNFVTAIGQMVIKFNEAHPAIAMILQGILLLIPALTLILLPLGLGVGYVKGLTLAFGFFFKMIAPVVTFLATMSATVWIVAAAIIALGAAFIWAWNNVAWFRDGILAAWEWIKTNTMIAWAAIVQTVQPALQAIVTFVMAKLAQIKAFWSEHGAQIMAVVSVFMAYIKGYISVGMAAIKTIFSVGWTIISSVIQIAWAAIQAVINIGISLITGLIATGMAILQGDWEGAWETIKGTAEEIWHSIEGFFEAIDLMQIGKDIIQGLIDGIGSMAGAAVEAAAGVAESIKGAVTGLLDIHSPSRVMFEYGGFVSEGMGLGIEDGSKYVQKMAVDMTGGIPQTYKPTSSAGSVTNSRSSITLSPTIYISGASVEGKSVKEQVKEGIQEVFDHLSFLYEPEGEY